MLVVFSVCLQMFSHTPAHCKTETGVVLEFALSESTSISQYKQIPCENKK